MTVTVNRDSAHLLAREHGYLRAELTVRAEELLAALGRGGSAEAERLRVVEFARGELLPHAEAEEEALRTVSDVDRFVSLTRAMPGSASVLTALVDEIDTGVHRVDIAAAVGALVMLLEARMDAEDSVLMPILDADGANLAALASDHLVVGDQRSPQ